eukprot:6490349-Amphidinium_carterae.1
MLLNNQSYLFGFKVPTRAEQKSTKHNFFPQKLRCAYEQQTSRRFRFACVVSLVASRHATNILVRAYCVIATSRGGVQLLETVAEYELCGVSLVVRGCAARAGYLSHISRVEAHT